MDQAQSTPPAEPAEDNADALEQPEAGAEAADGVIDTTADTTNTAAPKPPEKKPGGLKQKLRKFNIYLLFFILIIVVAIGIIMIAYFQSKKATTTSTLKTQQLTQQTLEQVANSDASVGNPQTVLNVESSAVFAGKVLVRQDLEVAGSLQIGGTVALSALTVSGTTQLGQLQVNQGLSVNGNTGIQGALTVAQSLQVNGNGSFSGPITAPQVTTSSLQLNSDLTITHHFIAGGPTPGRTSGPALGGGGTTSVSGSDTSGSVSINTGSSPAAGCFITVTFSSKYDSVPHVLITPVGSAAGGLAYYVTKTTSDFSICDASAPPGGASFGFDYFVVD